VGVSVSTVTTGSPLAALLAAPQSGDAPATPAPATSSAASALAAAEASPVVQEQQLMASSAATLFGALGSGSTLPDLSGLTATAQAYSLYTDPALLAQLATGPAAAGAASDAATAASSAGGGAVYSPPVYAFNPFDEASWWSDPSALGSTVDTSV